MIRRETSRPDKIRAALTAAGQLEREWAGKLPDTDRSRTPFMPFPVPQFLALLLEALPAAPGSRFLDVGAGPGSKMMLARDICELDVTGIEANDEYAQAALSQGLNVLTCDALDFDGYGEHDLIWLYRPLRDPDLQAGLEKVIWDGMAPGAVVMCAGLEAPPPSPQFWPELDDWELHRGIYRKLPPR
jgi:hypothetical protein